MRKKVTVTGSSGFIGKNVAEFLSSEGFDVIGFDKKNGQDLLSNSHLGKALRASDYVCHLAAVGDVYQAASDPKEASIIGLGGTANLITAAQKYPIKKIIYASTWEIYGKPQYQPVDEKHPAHPDHPYSVSKYAGELMIQSRLFKTPWLIFRLGTAYGKYMRRNAVVPLFVDQAKQKKAITITGDGLQKRQFTHVLDIANAFYLGLKSKVVNEVFNIVAEEGVTIKELAERVIKKYPTKIEYLPPRVADVEPAKVTSKKAQRLLLWQAKIRFQKGLDELLESE